MRGRKSAHLRIISATILVFFMWTFGGLYDIAYAIDTPSVIIKPSPKTQRPEARFQQAIEDIENTINDPSTSTDTKKAKLKIKKSEIDAIDTEIKNQFAQTEKKLRDANLPDKILQRHIKFVKHYTENLAELKANLDDIDKAKTDEEQTKAFEKAKTHLGKVKPQKKHTPLDPNKLPHRSAEPVYKEPRTKPADFLKDLQANPPQSPLGKGGSDYLMVASMGSLSGLLSMTATTGAIPAPTSADLAETVEVKFTPEILQLAQDLDYSPTKIFGFVRNYIDFVPTHGSIQGAHQTLLTGSGNAFDQASLMIALLRASGIHARYEYGTIELAIDRARNWLGGFTNANAVLSTLSLGGIPAVGLTAGGKITYVRMEHVWVKAYIDMIPSIGAVHKKGDTWIPFDPSFKEYDYSNGVDFGTAVPFDAEGFVSSINNTATIDSVYGSITSVDTGLAQSLADAYGARLNDYLIANHPMAIQEELVRNRKIIKHTYSRMPVTLPYKVSAKGWTTADLPASLRHTIRFSLVKDIYDDLAGSPFDYSITLPKLAQKRITLSYTPETVADRDMLRSLLPQSHPDGTLLQVSELPSSFPSYLISLIPELRIDGVVVASGTPIMMGQSESLTITIGSPTKGAERIRTDVVAGEYYAIAVDVMRQDEDYVMEKLLDHNTIVEQVKPGGIYPTKDALYGELLHTIVSGYFDQYHAYEQLYAKLSGIVAFRMPSVGIAQTSLDIDYIFDTPYTAHPEGMYLDIHHMETSAVALDGDSQRAIDFHFMTGVYASGLEHAVPEQVFSTPENPVEGVSTVKILSKSNEQSIPIYTITSENLALVLPRLQTGLNDVVVNSVNAGKVVIMPERNVTVNGWTGTGFIVYDPATGGGGYRISGGKNGGFLTVLGTHWMDVGAILYDEDPMYGLEVMMSGINLINKAQTLWMDVLKEAGGIAFDIGINFVPWGKVAGSAKLTSVGIAGSIVENKICGTIFEKAALYAANVIKNTKMIATALGKVIPDGIVGDLFNGSGALWEVKSGMYVCNTGNLKSMIDYGLENKIPVNLIMKEGAVASRPLKNAIWDTHGIIYEFNVVTKTIKEVVKP